MSKLKKYEVDVDTGRNVFPTILKLEPDEAERLGAREYIKDSTEQLEQGSDPGAQRAPAKPRSPRKPRAAKSARKPANTARAVPANKAAPAPATKGVEDATDESASE